VTTPPAIVRDSKASSLVDPTRAMPGPVVASALSDSIAAGTGPVSPTLLAPLPGDVSLLTLGQMYRQRQIAIALAATRAVASLWARHIDPARIADSWGTLRDVVQRLVQQYFSAASADSASFYGQMRVMSGYPATRVPMVQLPRKELAKVIDSQSMGTFFHNIKTVDEHVAAQSAGQSLEAASGRLALKGGRQTITEAVAQDPKAKGWERVIAPGACSFCSMLASRGAVYRSRESAKFLAHDHCHCTPLPLFVGQAPSQTSKDLAAEWQRVTRGKSGVNARKAWQDYWEANNGGRNSGATESAQEAGQGNGERFGGSELSNQAASRIGQPG